MKYFIDTEFIEGFHKPLFGKRRHFIDLISIGVVDEAGVGREYISSEYNYNDADDWVKANVILPLYISTVHGDMRNHCDVHNFHKVYGVKNSEIALELLNFFGCWRDQLFYRAADNTEIYGYYADYDLVLFCSLFGRMIDLPKGFPMYCKDLKQMLDDRAEAITQIEMTGKLFSSENWKVVSELPKSVHSIDDYTLGMKIELLKTDKDFPKQENEHNALADARWNKKLFEFLTQQTEK